MKLPAKRLLPNNAMRFARFGLIVFALLGHILSGASLHPALAKPPLALDPLFAEIVAEFGEHAICLGGGEAGEQDKQAEDLCMVECCPASPGFSITPFAGLAEAFRVGLGAARVLAVFPVPIQARYQSDIALRGPPLRR
ncbi:MAG: hypothetical protein KTR21_10770 [Rhodobacteraceae bacterium]|nr:hypothetical protein [Paracoccaceae bacterium]